MCVCLLLLFYFQLKVNATSSCQRWHPLQLLASCFCLCLFPRIYFKALRLLFVRIKSDFRLNTKQSLIFNTAVLSCFSNFPNLRRLFIACNLHNVSTTCIAQFTLIFSLIVAYTLHEAAGIHSEK